MSPGGINEAVRKQIRTMAGNRCGYCRSLQKYVLGMLEIDHIIPKAKGGTDDPDNLWERLSAVQWLQGNSNSRSRAKNRSASSAFQSPTTAVVRTLSME